MNDSSKRWLWIGGGTLAVIAVIVGVVLFTGDDDESTTTESTPVTTMVTTTTETTPDTTPATTPATTPVTEPAPSFEGDLVGTFSIDAAECTAGAPTAGSYFRMVQLGGTPEAGPFLPNADSLCTGDPSYSALTSGTDGGLMTGGFQAAPDPAFDATGNALAAGIFAPVKFFGFNFGGATDPAGTTPVITATDGVLTGDLSAFTAYYGGGMFNQGAPKPDGAGAAPTGTIDPVTGAYVLEWTSLIVGGSFDGFTGVWHLEGTFTPAG